MNQITAVIIGQVVASVSEEKAQIDRAITIGTR
jgi:hypothetical protein